MSQYHYRHPHQSERAHTNAFMGPGSSPPPQGDYPGLQTNPGPFGQGQSGLPVPYQSAGSAAGGSSKFNLNDLKALIDRMGGVEGIMTSLNKMSGIIQNVQKMAPMIKLLAGSLLPGKAATTNDLDLKTPRPRRRRKKRTSSHKRRRAAQTNKRRKSTKKSPR